MFSNFKTAFLGPLGAEKPVSHPDFDGGMIERMALQHTAAQELERRFIFDAGYSWFVFDHSGRFSVVRIRELLEPLVYAITYIDVTYNLFWLQWNESETVF